MSSVQTGQLISLLINNVLMVITVTVVALVAWLRWRWLQTSDHGSTRTGRRRCRWAYISFLLTVVTMLGMLASLSALALRAIVDVNVLVISAMIFFLVGVLALLGALGLWFWDMAGVSSGRRHRQGVRSAALLPASVEAPVRRRRGMRRARRKIVAR